MKKILICLFLFNFGFLCQKIVASANSSADSFKKEADNLDSFQVLVNKKYYLKEDFHPKNLMLIKNNKIDREIYINKYALIQYQKLKELAESFDFDIQVFSGYRSYSYQKDIYIEDAYHALPGESEHQTGLALDISVLDVGLIPEMEGYPVYDFLSNNAHKFGFILRYPKDKEAITKYNFEPWHYRFVGLATAKKIYANNLTLEEFLNRV